MRTILSGSGHEISELAKANLAEPGDGMTAMLPHGTAIRNAAHALEPAGEGVQPPPRWITAEPVWAIDVTLRARFSLAAFGGLCVRKRCRALVPLTPSGPFA
jgi:hypothetical protein